MSLFKRKKKEPEPIVAAKPSKIEVLLATRSRVCAIKDKAKTQEINAIKSCERNQRECEKEMKEATTPAATERIKQRYRPKLIRDISKKIEAEKYIDFCQIMLDKLRDQKEELEGEVRLSMKIMLDIVKEHTVLFDASGDSEEIGKSERTELEKDFGDALRGFVGYDADLADASIQNEVDQTLSNLSAANFVSITQEANNEVEKLIRDMEKTTQK